MNKISDRWPWVMTTVLLAGALTCSRWGIAVAANQAGQADSPRILECQADLAMTALLCKASVVAGGSLRITDITYNASATCTANTTVTKYWISTTSNGPSVCSLGTLTLGALPPGSNYLSVKTTFTCSSLQRGSYWLVATANHAVNTNIESVFSNNTNSRPLSVL